MKDHHGPEVELTATERTGTVIDMFGGACAGAVGVWAMDLVGWVMLRSEDHETLVQDLRARPHHGKAWGKIADTAAQVRSVQTGTRRTDDAVGAADAGTLTRAAQVSGVSPPNQRPTPAATAFHFALGMLPGAFYGAARRTRPTLRTGRGALYGLILFVVMDETAAPLTGVASNPGRYPWPAHARGLVAHLVLGVVTETLLQAAERFRCTPATDGSVPGRQANPCHPTPRSAAATA